MDDLEITETQKKGLLVENTRYKWLRLKLEEDILNEYRPKDKFLSQREIMSRYEASYSTVERALSELVDSGLLVRIHGKGTFVCEPKPYGQGTKKLAIVMSDNVNFAPRYFYSQILIQISETLSKNGYSFTFIYVTDYEGNEPLTKRLLGKEEGFSGAILIGNICDSLIELLHAEKFPVTLVDKTTDLAGIPYVATDNVSGAYRAVSFLAQHNCRKIAFVSTPLHTSFLERYEGYCNALVDHGMKLNRHLVVKNLRFEFEEEALMPLFDSADRPDAIFFANDAIAVKCMAKLQKMGISIPETVSVIGFDGNYISEHSHPPLSSMLVDTVKMGKLAADQMVELLSGKKPAPVLLDTELLARQSVNAK